MNSHVSFPKGSVINHTIWKSPLSTATLRMLLRNPWKESSDTQKTRWHLQASTVTLTSPSLMLELELHSNHHSNYRNLLCDPFVHKESTPESSFWILDVTASAPRANSYTRWMGKYLLNDCYLFCSVLKNVQIHCCNVTDLAALLHFEQKAVR